jgi:hypothetical protein
MSKKQNTHSLRANRASPRDTISAIKIECNWANLLASGQSYNSPSSLLHKIAFGVISPSRYEKINIQPSLYVGSEDDEARWIFLSLYLNRTKLLASLKQENLVQNGLIYGDYVTAENELNKLEQVAGVSLSSLYYRFFLRHGTLQGQLRSPFEENRLILQRRPDGKGYAENDYWPRALGILNLDDRAQRLHELLSDFSQSIDDTILKVKDQFLHISTESKKRMGLFDYSYTDAELLEILEADFANITAHDQFLDRAFRIR